VHRATRGRKRRAHRWLPFRPLCTPGNATLATQQELSDFLIEVERRAFKQAVFAVRNEQAALDLVQDTMLRLVESYSSRPAQELPLLFQRILQNAIRDYFRRAKVRLLWTTLLSSLRGKEEDERDPLDTLVVPRMPGAPDEPDAEVARSEILGAIEAGLASLPPRQREAFVLRYWEQLDVSETARAMRCSEGSVKTHCSRATHALAAYLKARGISL
jgi:RNA polymerase sigma-70 factor (ECF subfamily)